MLHAVEGKPQYCKATDEDGEHLDRIVTLWYSDWMFGEALQVCEGLMKSLQEIGGVAKDGAQCFVKRSTS
jgi:hypothetical protein